MKTSVIENRLVVISDLHIGNPYFRRKAALLDFLNDACARGYSLCINGDGLDIVQTSFYQLSRQVPELIKTLRGFAQSGQKIYYVIGNHDLALEEFLEDWGAIQVVPFLNVASGTQRFHIQHGHIYDAYFLRSPGFYEWSMRLAGWMLKIFPDIYRVSTYYSHLMDLLIPSRPARDSLLSPFALAAQDISLRGFDAVVFGHTHWPGVLNVTDDAVYINTGSWLSDPHFLKIDNGAYEPNPWPLV